jgi:hypothetical protein
MLVLIALDYLGGLVVFFHLVLTDKCMDFNGHHLKLFLMYETNVLCGTFAMITNNSQRNHEIDFI